MGKRLASSVEQIDSERARELVCHAHSAA